MKEKYGTVLVGYDFTNGEDSDIVIVAIKKPNEEFEIINAFFNEEAVDIYSKLVGGKEDEK